MDGARYLNASRRIHAFGKFAADQATALESESQRRSGSPNGHDELSAEPIQKRHAEALKLNRFGFELLIWEIEMAVYEVKVRRTFDSPVNCMPPPVVLHAERVPRRGNSNALRVTQLVLGQRVQNERLDDACCYVGLKRLQDLLVAGGRLTYCGA